MVLISTDQIGPYPFVFIKIPYASPKHKKPVSTGTVTGKALRIAEVFLLVVASITSLPLFGKSAAQKARRFYFITFSRGHPRR
jgi:hypothetical protein